MVAMPMLPLAVGCPHLAPVPQGPVTPIEFVSCVAAVPSVRSGPQHRAIPELFKGVRAPLTNLFLTVMVKGAF